MTMHPPYAVENQPVAAPAGPVVALPLVLMVLFFQRRIVAGLAAGGLKQ